MSGLTHKKHGLAPIGHYVGNQNLSRRLWVRHATRREGLLGITPEHESSQAVQAHQLVDLRRLRMGARTSDARLDLPRALPLEYLGLQPQLGTLRVLDALVRNRAPYSTIVI